MRAIIAAVYMFCRWQVSGSGLSPPIRIALAVDMRSLKDFLVLAHSVVLTALKPEQLYLHVVACGKNLDEAKRMKDMVVELTHKCIPGLGARHLEVVAFTLPPSSGFAKQLVTVVQKSHWYSPTGADMARFFLAELFPAAGRLLYLDNDIVVTCCLEEIFYTDLAPVGTKEIVAAIALDDLKWATSTQFYRHYNRTHPLVIRNIRRGRGVVRSAWGGGGKKQQQQHPGELSASELSADEFMDALPKYPNDGVLLIDVDMWRKYNILPLMNEIAEANGRGEYVVSMGTQQFTVLALHDRWKELSPRANLRHFPDMARGYLMWYLYTGIVHYAGQSKPQHVCDANSALDHRASTYNPWALNVGYLAKACSKLIPNNTRKCGEIHIPATDTFDSFLSLVHQVAGKGGQEGLLYLRIGGLYNWRSSGSQDPIARFDKEMLRNSSWSWRVFDADQARSKQSLQTLQEFWTKGDGRGKRTWAVVHDNICDGTDPLDPDTGHVTTGNTKEEGKYKYPLVDRGGNIDDATSPDAGRLLPCLSVLASIKQEKAKPKKAHWDVMAIAVDVLPTPGRELASTLGALKSLQLEFMRPKFIVARIGGAGDALDDAKRFLQRHGYSVWVGLGALGGGGRERGRNKNIVYAHRVNKLEL